MADLPRKEFPLSGKMITSIDPVSIGENFQELTNTRYTNIYPKGIRGMSRVNPTTALTPKKHIRSVFHFHKDQPSESHLLVQAWNSTLDESAILQNTSTIGSTGDFSATTLLTETSGSAVGIFSNAPGGNVAYCNKTGSYIWGGSEMKIGSFVNYAPDDSFRYDYTEQVRNTLTTGAKNIATLYRVADTVDANTTLLLHLNGSSEDSSASSHTVTTTGVTYSTARKVLGSGSASLDGSSAKFEIPDHANFNFNGGNFCVDARIYADSAATLNPIYHQSNIGATAYSKLYTDSNGALRFQIYADGTTASLNMRSPNSVIKADTWYHAEVNENGNNYYLFLDGTLQTTRSKATRARNYDASVDIGTDGSNYFNGYLDEVRLNNTSRHTANFEVPTTEYNTTFANKTHLYVGFTRPIQGFKIYIGTANTTTGSMSVDYWSGSAWVSVSSLTDNTASGGIPLAQTGTVTFTSTESTSKVRILDGSILYWYRVGITDCDATATIYHITGDAPFQTIKDIWDGINRYILSFQVYDNSTYNEYTANVYEYEYDSANTGTMAELDSLGTSDYLVAGFGERQLGISFNLVSGKGNTTANTLASVYYWNGTTWTTVGAVNDGTAQGGISMSKSGVISWNPPDEGSEFKKEITKEIPLYYYKISFSKALSGDVQVFHISGFPAQKTVGNYSFPVNAMNALWLLSDQDGDKNKVIKGATNAPDIWNGEDVLEFHIGDESEVVAGSPIYLQMGSSLYDAIALHKKNGEIWIIFYNDGYYQYRVSKNNACVAPNTMRQISLVPETTPGSLREVPIWQGANNVYIFGGKGPIPVGEDIKNYFDKESSTAINTSKISNSYGFVDEANDEYHWLFAQGTSSTIDKEFVFDFKRMKWFKINRGTGNALQSGTSATDTNGNKYSYGSKEGYLVELETGSSFDGTAIAHTLWTGDMPFRALSEETSLRVVELINKSKNSTSNTITGTHYKDSKTTADSTFTLEPQSTTRRVVQPVQQLKGGPGVFHSIKLQTSTSNEDIGFEPLYLAMLYKKARQKTYDGG